MPAGKDRPTLCQSKFPIVPKVDVNSQQIGWGFFSNWEPNYTWLPILKNKIWLKNGTFQHKQGFKEHTYWTMPVGKKRNTLYQSMFSIVPKVDVNSKQIGRGFFSNWCYSEFLVSCRGGPFKNVVSKEKVSHASDISFLPLIVCGSHTVVGSTHCEREDAYI